MSAPRRLLMTGDAVGGVWQYAVELARALVPHGIETTLALLGPGLTQPQRTEATGITVIETGLPLDWMADDAAQVRAAGAAIADLARQMRADLVQLNQPALAAAPMPAPVVAAVHSCVATWWRAVETGPLPDGFAWQTDLVRAGLAAADAVVCPSRAFADAVRDEYALPTLPTVVHNGRTAFAAPPCASHDCVLTAGRLWDRAKDIATLDRTAAMLAVPFKAVGPCEGPNGERQDFAHLALTGRLDEAALAALLASRPVFASAARYEPFGLAVLEAAQAGCALVLSDIPTFRELWGGVAQFVDPGDARGFAEAIEALICDATLRRVRGEAARARAVRFTPQATAAAMAQLYGGFVRRTSVAA